MPSARELDALLSRAMGAHQAGRLAEAQRDYEALLKQAPAHPPALHFLGLCHFQSGNPDRGIELIGKALAAKPDYVEAYYNLATALQALGRVDEALQHYDRALTVEPNNPDALNNVGAILLEQKRYGEAVGALERALSLNPRSPQSLSNMGTALRELQRSAEAIPHLSRALEIDPGNAEICCNLGMTLLHMKRPEAALAAFDQAVALHAELAEAWLGRAQSLEALNRGEESAAAYDKALQLNPRLPWSPGSRFFVKMLNCDWQNFAADSASLIAGVRSGDPVATPFVLLVAPSTAADQRKCAELAVALQHPASKSPLWRGERYNHERLRVAYISADFRDHAVARVMAGLFEQHDRTRFETTAIALSADDGGAMRKRLVRAFDHFEDVGGRTDYEIAGLIREREIDIAVDLMGFTQGGRINVMAKRPAPIQVSYLGWSATTGAGYVDYVLGDEIIIPSEQQSLYSEKIAYLPHSFMVMDDKRHVPEATPSRADAGLPERGFVFCSFNNSYKFTPDVFDVWMRLLKSVEGSVLWMLAGSKAISDNLGREAQNRGVAPERLIFAPRVPVDDHLARHRLADLFLDTLPYNAHTTTADALWTGLPVVTSLGEAFAGRVAGSLLNAVGLGELVTTSLADYERLVLRLARDPAALAAIKSKLATNRNTAPLFDTVRSTRDIETAYLTMWQRQRDGLGPETFSVPSRAENQR